MLYNEKVANVNLRYLWFISSVGTTRLENLSVNGFQTKSEVICDYDLEELALTTVGVVKIYGSLAQLVEHMTFNHGVPGSSPG